MTTNNMIDNFPNAGPIQIVYVNGAGSTVASGTPTDITGSSVTITPKFTTSNIVIIASFSTQVLGGGGNQWAGFIQCLRAGSAINGSPYAELVASIGGSPSANYDSISFYYVDSPATTSATTYKFQQYINNFASSMVTANGTVVLMEYAPI